jgi:hypothetical protein
MPKYVNAPKVLDTLIDPKVVNCFKGKKLGNTYYICGNDLYKKTRSGKYREVCLQHNSGDKYAFFFVKNNSGGKDRVGLSKLSLLTFTEDQECKTPEKS